MKVLILHMNMHNTPAIETLETGKAGDRLSITRFEGLLWFLYTAVAAILVFLGYQKRIGADLNPEYGSGYWLGIIGGVMMLVLLIYPIRKRIKMLKNIGKISFWFRFHMLLGITGPLLVVFHGRFTFGLALNTKMAMISMLIVFASGFVGRFLYARIHRGYTGRKLEMRSLLDRLHDELGCLVMMGELGQVVRDDLAPLEARAVAAGGSFSSGASSILSIGLVSRVTLFNVRRKLNRMVKLSDDRTQSSAERKAIMALAGEIAEASRRAAAFAFYDRLFRLWHLLHLPLLFLLLGAGFLHVYAVHKY
jgi:hypothetical protein